MRKLMWFSIGFCAACLLAVYLLGEDLLLYAAAAAAAAAAVVRLLLRRQRPAAVLLAGLAIGLLWSWGYSLLVIRPAHAAAGSSETAAAEICSYSEKTDYGCCVTAWSETPPGRVKTRFYLYDCDRQLIPGDRISGTFRLRPSDRDAAGETYLDAQAKGIHLIGTGTVSSLDRPDRVPLRYYPQITAHALNRILDRTVPKDAAGFLRALVTGDRDGLSDVDRDLLSAAGVSHVIAVSGMHVGLLMTLLLLVLGRGGWVKTAVKALVAVGFALLTGASASVMRATVMLLLLLPATGLRRTYDAPTALGTAALFLLMQNPWIAANVSFQLSFCAVAGLLLAEEPLRLRLRKLRPVRGLLDWEGPSTAPLWLKRRLAGAVRGTAEFAVGCVSASVSVLLFTTPITALVFRSVSIYAVLGNLLVLPVVLPCFAGGLLCLALGAVWPFLGALAGSAAAWPVRWIYLVSRLVSGLPFARLPVDTPYGVGFLLAAYLVILLFVLRKPAKGQPRKRLLHPVLQVALLLVITCVFTVLSRPDGDFSVTALDVGQGQCLLLRVKSYCAVVDCGGSKGDRPGVLAADCLERQGLDEIDALVLTHYDADHISGAERLMERISVQTLYLPDVAFDPGRRAWVEQAAERCGVPVVYVTEDLLLEFTGGSMQIFAPVSGFDDNAASLSVLFSAGEYDILTTGDMDIISEYDLLLTHELPRVEIFVAGHHGSRHSSSEELLERIQPQIVIISVGKDNRYGHPSAEALARFEQIGAEVLRTDLLGDIVIGR